jgi:hypothetical protein
VSLRPDPAALPTLEAQRSALKAAGMFLLAALLLTTSLMLAGCGGKPKKAKTGLRPAASPSAPPDCDADDRGHREVPDCGFLEARVYFEWTWVQAGQTEAPPGWNADDDRRLVLSRR